MENVEVSWQRLERIAKKSIKEYANNQRLCFYLYSGFIQRVEPAFFERHYLGSNLLGRTDCH